MIRAPGPARLRVGSSPSVADGVVYIGRDDGFFYVLESVVTAG